MKKGANVRCLETSHPKYSADLTHNIKSMTLVCKNLLWSKKPNFIHHDTMFVFGGQHFDMSGVLLCVYTLGSGRTILVQILCLCEQTCAFSGDKLWETYWVRWGSLFPVQRRWWWWPLTLQAVWVDGEMVVEEPGRAWVQEVPTTEMRCSDWTL